MQTKKETIENFDITYKKHHASKSIKISLKEENKVLITMPYLCPYKSARDFFLKNFDKIKAFKPQKTAIDENFKTKFDTLKIVKSDKLETKTETRGQEKIIYFYYPSNLDFQNDLVQKEAKNALKLALKIEAKNYLPQRLDFLAKKFGFSFQKVSLRNQKTRFGSCTFKNDINLNINLMNYDFDVIDYVLIHELCHTRVKNHSTKFWAEVEKYCPDYKNLRKILKQ